MNWLFQRYLTTSPYNLPGLFRTRNGFLLRRNQIPKVQDPLEKKALFLFSLFMTHARGIFSRVKTYSPRLSCSQYILVHVSPVTASLLCKTRRPKSLPTRSRVLPLGFDGPNKRKMRAKEFSFPHPRSEGEEDTPSQTPAYFKLGLPGPK